MSLTIPVLISIPVLIKISLLMAIPSSMRGMPLRVTDEP
jgi:hypothetical protein